MALHADQIRFSEMCGGNLRLGVGIGALTDTNVASADTVAGLKTNSQSVNLHADLKRLQDSLPRAIDYLSYSSELTDALILGLTTTEGLVDLTQQGPLNNQAIKILA